MRRIGFLCAAGIIVCLSGFFQNVLSTECLTGNIAEIPDFAQTDPRADLPGGGEQYCAPVSVSNSFMWLFAKGYERIVSTADEQDAVWHELARELGSSRYMDTNRTGGTGVTGLLKGVSTYLQDRGYSYSYLGYQGWRDHQARFSTGVTVPDLQWVIDGLRGDSAVWLNIGWYSYNSSTNIYRRTGGHWVTLVGYGVDKEGHPAPGMLVIHDPYPKGSYEPSDDYYRVRRIESGRMTGSYSGLPQNAAGFHVIEREGQPGSRSSVGIIDGAVVLRMSSVETVAAAGTMTTTETY